jgi:hypothetical protein
MTALPEALASFLRASPGGTRLWMRGLGHSMRPVLQPGDALEVERCDEDVLRVGDIALVAGGEASLTAHLVVRIAPLCTAAFGGSPDPPREVLGRAVRIDRAGLRLRMGRRMRFVLRTTHRLLCGIRGI